ncbi:hypothetical protein EDB89DRAFT_2069044 [Lactarius sanguifluus]|nr:hypothetical protein EDB89DRAFT_2069044 [Lactarius sanguifluus]
MPRELAITDLLALQLLLPLAALAKTASTSDGRDFVQSMYILPIPHTIYDTTECLVVISIFRRRERTTSGVTRPFRDDDDDDE